MSISHQQENQLRRIEAGLRRSDPRLAAIMSEFGQFYPSQNMPTVEKVGGAPSGEDHLGRAIAWMVAVIAMLAATIVLSRMMVG